MRFCGAKVRIFRDTANNLIIKFILGYAKDCPKKKKKKRDFRKKERKTAFDM